MLGIAVFFSASLLFAMFIAFRMWEEKRGVRLFASSRTMLDHWVIDIYHGAVTGSIPRHYRMHLLVFLRTTLHRAVLLTVATLRAIERPLTRLSFRMRMASPGTAKKEVSSFLKTIVPRRPLMKKGVEKSAQDENSI